MTSALKWVAALPTLPWRVTFGLTTAMAGPEAGYMLACLFLLLGAMIALPCLAIGVVGLLG